jgi:DnaK suppressor protein
VVTAGIRASLPSAADIHSRETDFSGARLIPADPHRVNGAVAGARAALIAHVSAELTTTPAKSRALSVAQETKIRTRLVAELGELHELEDRLRADLAAGIETRRGAQNDETDDPEGSNLAFEGLQVGAMLQQTRRHIDEIEEALGRLDLGTYGTCVECSGTIAAGRLEARPSTSYCINCAS